MSRVGRCAAVAASMCGLATVVGPAWARPLPGGDTVKCTVEWTADNLTWTPGNPEPQPPEPHTPMPYDCL